MFHSYTLFRRVNHDDLPCIEVAPPVPERLEVHLMSPRYVSPAQIGAVDEICLPILSQDESIPRSWKCSEAHMRPLIDDM